MPSFGRRQAAQVLPLLLLAGTLIAPAARGGQVRVNVGAGGSFFSPYAVNINEGDHVVWVWVGAGHNVANWSTPDDSINFSFDGTIFQSNPSAPAFGQPVTTRYTWKSQGTGHFPFVCVPHTNLMSGRVIVSPLATPPTIPVADFRLTEVQFNDPNGLDRIEIANLGGAAGDLRSFRLAVSGTGTGVAVSANDFPVAAQGRVIVHTNETGTNGVPAGHLYVPGLGDLGNLAGSVALYAPATLSLQNALTNPDMILDFVQWGAGNQPNETTAALANFWTAGTAIEGVAATHSIEYCASATLEHGRNRWEEIFPPNFGFNSDCTTPTLRDTWGHLKIIYRQ